MKTFILFIAAISGSTANSALATTIDFESISSGTILREQFVSLGVLVRPEPPSGQVRAVGENGISDIGGSGTQVVDVGSYLSEPTVFWFVDPKNPSNRLAVEQFSLRLGNGGSLEAGFAINLAHRKPQFSTGFGFVVDEGTPGAIFTSPPGRWTGFQVASYSSVRVHREVMDDLTYTLLPEPGSGTIAAIAIASVCAALLTRRIRR